MLELNLVSRPLFLHGRTFMIEIFFKVTKFIYLRKFQNPNIVVCYGIFIEEPRNQTDYLSIFMEVCNCSLADVFLCDKHSMNACQCNPHRRESCHLFQESDRNSPEYNESFHLFTKLFGDILNGLAYLHNHEFAHRDLKLSNILVSLP